MKRKIFIVLPILITFILITLIVFLNTEPKKNQKNTVSQETPEKPIDLGPQVYNQSAIAAKAGMDSKGNAYLYTILHGTPTSLAVVDLNTNKVVKVCQLPDSTSSTALDIAPDGTVWIGGTNSGTLYSYDPDSKEMVNHGHVLEGTGDTSIQDIFINKDYIYGVTAYGANLFRFNINTKKREYILPTEKQKQYAKSVVVNDENNYLFVSTGSTAELLKWNIEDNSKEAILSDKFKSETYIEKMKLIDNQYLFTKFYPSKTAAVYDINTNKIINEFNSSSWTFSDKNPQTNEIYYSYNEVIYAYNTGSGTTRNTHTYLPENTEALSLDIISLKKDPEKNIVVGLIDNDGRYFLFDPISNEIEIKQFAIPPQPVNLHRIFSDPGNKDFLYINGYMSGGLTKYDTRKKTGVQLNELSQLESAHFLNGKLYLGAYPKARLTVINNPKDNWDKQEPKEIVRLKSYGQERIPALTSYNDHLFAGTYPQYTSSGGVLLDYDTVTDTYKVYENYINNHSIISLHPHGDYIYGGTSVHANYQKATDGAKFFRFKPSNPEEKEIIDLPLKASLVMSLITGPDKNIWGAANGTIFSYNPETEQFKTVKILDAISGRYNNAKMLVGKDGFIYGTIESKLFKIDPNTMEYEILIENNAREIGQDSEGNLYFIHLSRLYIYPLNKNIQ